MIRGLSVLGGAVVLFRIWKQSRGRSESKRAYALGLGPAEQHAVESPDITVPSDHAQHIRLQTSRYFRIR